VETVSDFAELPPLGVIERLGEEGGRLQALVEGRGSRPLRITRPREDYTAEMHLDDPLSSTEPLLFLISGMVHGIVKKLAGHGLAVGSITTTLTPMHESRIQFPSPVQDPQIILKQVQLDLEIHKPKRAVTAAAVELQPALPRIAQHGLFTPSTPEPGQLQTLLARLRAITGISGTGSPELLNTYRPDAWTLRQDVLFETAPSTGTDPRPAGTRLSFRRFRPPLPARVEINGEHRPVHVTARGARGRVEKLSGPWRTSGEWWTGTSWARDEWDTGLDDGALYRIYREHTSNAWFIDGIYD
jgi:protein ImuB